MTTRPFTQHYDPRDIESRTLIGQLGYLGVLVLVVLDRLFPEKIARDRLKFIFNVGDAKKTLDRVLGDLEVFGYASRSGSAAHEHWIATDLGRTTISQIAASTAASVVTLPSVTQPAQPALPLLGGGNLPESGDKSPQIVENGARDYLSRSDRSSSSDLIDLDQIDLEEEKNAEKISHSTAGGFAVENSPSPFQGEGQGEGERRSAVTAWCQQYSITGDKQRDVLADPFCTVARLDAWRREMQRRAADGTFKPRNPNNKFAALNYAIACCLHHDEPPATPSPVGEGGASAPGEGGTPTGYTHLLHDPVFDQIVLNLAQHYGPEVFMTLNPRLVTVDERPNKFTVLVTLDRPELRPMIAKLAAGYSRKSYSVQIVTAWPGITSGDAQPEIAQRIAALKVAYQAVVAGPVYLDDAEEQSALKWLAEQSCTAERLTDVYRRLKAQDFWKNKSVSIKTIAKNFGQSTAAAPATRSSISRYTTVRA